MNSTITLPFSTPRDIEVAAQTMAALTLAGATFEADRDGVWIVIKITG